MRTQHLLLTFCLALLCGCVNKVANVKPNPPPTPNAPTSSTQSSLPSTIAKMISNKNERTEDMLVFIESYSNLGLDAQKKTFAVNQLENKSSFMVRAKTAIMLALPTSRVRDNGKAQALLQDLLREEGLESSESALLGLLYEYAIDDGRQLQKTRDDAKKLENWQQKYEALEQKHEALMQKNEALTQKLNELKNIEKTMSERAVKSETKP